MKGLLISIVLFSILSTDTSKKDLASFEISLKRNGDVVKMKCLEGCAWTELLFNLKKQPQSTVNSIGIFHDMSAAENEESEFSFNVELAKNGLKFTSKSGTAWKELSYGSRPSKIMYLDERGISSKKTH